jgi:phosphate transport system substrate-binding protein
MLLLGQGAVAAEITVAGSTDACSGLFAAVSDQIRDEAGIDVRVSPRSEVQALLDLDAGLIDVATSDVAFGKLIEEAEGKGYLIIPENFQVQGIGTNSILVYVNRVNRVPRLSQRQLRDIFSGRVTNWKQVGGANQKIVVVWGGDTANQNWLFRNYVIGNVALTKSVIPASNQRDILEKIVATPGAIGIASSAYKSARTHNPVTPFVSSKIVAITKGAPSAEVQKVLEIVKAYDF